MVPPMHRLAKPRALRVEQLIVYQPLLEAPHDGRRGRGSKVRARQRHARRKARSAADGECIADELGSGVPEEGMDGFFACGWHIEVYPLSQPLCDERVVQRDLGDACDRPTRPLAHAAEHLVFGLESCR